MILTFGVRRKPQTHSKVKCGSAIISLNVQVQVCIEKKMIHIPNEDDTVGFDAFPPPHIALINIHLCVSEWRQQTACTASYTPSAIDPAMR